MKEWIKIETDVMYNENVRKLYAERHYLGVFTYLMVRLHIEALSDAGIPLAEAIAYGGSFHKKSSAERIICDYGLFEIIDGNVRPLSLEEMKQSSHTGEHTDGHVIGHTDGHVIGHYLKYIVIKSSILTAIDTEPFIFDCLRNYF